MREIKEYALTQEEMAALIALASGFSGNELFLNPYVNQSRQAIIEKLIHHFWDMNPEMYKEMEKVTNNILKNKVK